jgi:hypothetical protein
MTPLQWKKKNTKSYQDIAVLMGFPTITGRNKVWRHFTGQGACDLKTALRYYSIMQPDVDLVAIEKAMKKRNA